MGNKFIAFVGGVITGGYIMYNHLYKKIAKVAVKHYEERLEEAEKEESEK